MWYPKHDQSKLKASRLTDWTHDNAKTLRPSKSCGSLPKAEAASSNVLMLSEPRKCPVHGRKHIKISLTKSDLKETSWQNFRCKSAETRGFTRLKSAHHAKVHEAPAKLDLVGISLSESESEDQTWYRIFHDRIHQWEVQKWQTTSTVNSSIRLVG